MMIWRGLGILVPVVVIATMIATQLLVDMVMGHGYYTAHGWPKLAATTLAAIALFALGQLTNISLPPPSDPRHTGTPDADLEAEADAQTDKRPSHTFFFIPIKYWSVIVFLLGILMAAS